MSLFGNTVILVGDKNKALAFFLSAFVCIHRVWLSAECWSAMQHVQLHMHACMQTDRQIDGWTDGLVI